MTEAISIATIFEDFGLDHAPDGWPPIKQMNLTAAAAELRRLEAQLQKETAARQAAQIEAEALKERLVRADAEKCAAVLAERIAPKAPMQEPVHRLIYPGGGKALFNRLWHLTCNAVATQSGMRVRTDVMPMREMKEFLDHLCVLVDSPPQPVPAPVQELCDLCGDINANPASEADMAVYRGIAARYFKDTAPVQEQQPVAWANGPASPDTQGRQFVVSERTGSSVTDNITIPRELLQRMVSAIDLLTPTLPGLRDSGNRWLRKEIIESTDALRAVLQQPPKEKP